MNGLKAAVAGRCRPWLAVLFDDIKLLVLCLTSPTLRSTNRCHKNGEPLEDEMASSGNLQLSARPHLRPDSHGRLCIRERMRSHQANRVIRVAVPAMLSNAIPAQNEVPCPLSELIATAGTIAETDGSVGDVTLEGREVVFVTP